MLAFEKPRHQTESLHHVRRADSQKGHIEEQENARPQVRGKISSPIIPATKTQASGGKKKAGRTDVIDTLDMTGSLYGFRPHHDGPFDAVSSARNRSNAQRPSPMDAFNPRKQPQDGGLKPPSAAANTRGSGLSPRAQATLSAMDTLDLNASSIGGPYSSVKTELNSSKLSVGRSRRNSDSNVSCHSVHLGYPMTDFSRSASYADEEAEQERAYDDKKMTRSQAMKSARLAEAFGLQEAEAWEDFGRSAYDRASANRDTVYIPSASQLQDHGGMRPTKMDKASRANRVASVWDMEATLRENSPVAATAPPPVPALPSGLQNEISLGQPISPNGAGVKRSKSFIQRMRKTRNAPNVPSTPDDSMMPSSPERLPASPANTTSPGVAPSLHRAASRLQASEAAKRGKISHPRPAADSALLANYPAPLRDITAGEMFQDAPERTSAENPHFTSRASVTADLLDNLGLDDDEKDANSDAWLAPMINKR